MVKNKKNKKATAISLNEFNADLGVTAADPALAALPSAPRGEEEWAKEGIETSGRYAGRVRLDLDDGGFQGRNALDDAEFAERDWTRRGPMAASGPGPDGDRAGFSSGAGVDDDAWGTARRGPLPVDTPDGFGMPASDADWSNARRGPLPPVDGSAAPPLQDSDWSNPRRGPMAPVEGQQLGGPDADGWANARRGPPGPIPGAQAPLSSGPDADGWANARTGPLPPAEGNHPLPTESEIDWSARKGPVAAAPGGDEADWAQARGRAAPPAATIPAPQAEPDWGEARKKQPPPPTADSTPAPRATSEDWAAARSARPEPPPAAPAAIPASDPAPRDPDWTNVRRKDITPPNARALQQNDSKIPANQTSDRDWNSVRKGPGLANKPRLPVPRAAKPPAATPAAASISNASKTKTPAQATAANTNATTVVSATNSASTPTSTEAAS